jgi:hypothetical protein
MDKSAFLTSAAISRKWLDDYIVDVTPAPIFTRFERSHDGVFCFFEVLGGVLVFRGIAAADVAADFAEAQMNPRIAHLQALFAAIGVRGAVLNLVQV